MITDPHLIIEHPEWAGRNVTLICGPPGAGKTTVGLRLHPRTLDIGELPPGTPRQRTRLFGRMAWRIGRNPDANVAVIRGAPTQRERKHQQDLCHPSRTIIMLTDAATCHERVTKRNRTDAAQHGRGLQDQHGAIDEWWRRWDGGTVNVGSTVSGYDWP